jgi:hypothetical protein
VYGSKKDDTLIFMKPFMGSFSPSDYQLHFLGDFNMNDKVEVKIVSDAEMDNFVASVPEIKVMPIVRASWQVAERMSANSLKPIDHDGVKSIKALVSYAAANLNVQETSVESMVSACFDVRGVSNIKQKDYNEAIRFLVDFCITELSN